MKKSLFILLALIICLNVNAQEDFNFNLLSQVAYAEGCNDIWGYADENGLEYALVGTRGATAILSLEDPTNPIERAYIPGTSSTWRDIKTWGTYAYVVADVGNDGVLIINLENAPSDITWNFLNVPFQYNGVSESIQKCHNLYIDENGILYLSGCNTGTNGVMMFDLTEDPENPKFVGAESAAYSHDNVARGDTLWSSDLSSGFSVWDVSDKENPVELARQSTTMNFTHNAWFSDDNKYLFTTDERPNAYMDAYDVSDLGNIRLLDSYQPIESANQGVIPHNAHYINGYLVTSWYTDGVKIIDGHRPQNMIEVGSYDSYDGPHGGFNGCWGAYPYLPSGLVLINDIQTGLYVLEPTYERACYLEGLVTDANTGEPIENVSVTITASRPNQASTDINGDYKSGMAESGTYEVVFEHIDYKAETITVELVNGEVTVLDVALGTAPTHDISGLVIDALTKEPVPNAQIIVSNSSRTYSAISNDQGEFDLSVVQDPQDFQFDIVAGSWGYDHKFLPKEVVDQNIQLTIELDSGYQDDFVLDQGWTVSGDAPRGIWERGVPIGTQVSGQFANPNSDVTSDIGEQCYVSGNGGGGAGDDDVDNGVTILTSPEMDLSEYEAPYLSYRTWFFNGSRPNPNDSMVISLTNGKETVSLEVIRTTIGIWRDSSIFKLSDYISLEDPITLSVAISDDPQSGHVVEGGFDEFRVVDKISTSDQNVDLLLWTASPSPFGDQLTVNPPDQDSYHLEILSLDGKTVWMNKDIQGQKVIATGRWLAGTYIIRLQSTNGTTDARRVVKH